MSTVALYIIIKKVELTQSPSDCSMWYIHTTEYYSVKKELKYCYTYFSMYKP
jgi:hypothetical protein